MACDLTGTVSAHAVGQHRDPGFAGSVTMLSSLNWRTLPASVTAAISMKSCAMLQTWLQ